MHTRTHIREWVQVQYGIDVKRMQIDGGKQRAIEADKQHFARYLPGLRLRSRFAFALLEPAPRIEAPPAGGLTKAKSAFNSWPSNVRPSSLHACIAACASSCSANSSKAYPYSVETRQFRKHDQLNAHRQWIRAYNP